MARGLKVQGTAGQQEQMPIMLKPQSGSGDERIAGAQFTFLRLLSLEPRVIEWWVLPTHLVYNLDNPSKKCQVILDPFKVTISVHYHN